MSKSFYEIDRDYLELVQELEYGEVTPELEAQLKINESERDSKSLAYLAVIRNFEAQNSQISDEIKRLQALKKVNDNKVTRLKNNLLDAVNLYGAYEVGLNKFSTRKSSALEITDLGEIPKDYIIEELVQKVDKDAIKKSIKAGEEVKGAQIIERKNLKIN